VYASIDAELGTESLEDGMADLGGSRLAADRATKFVHLRRAAAHMLVANGLDPMSIYTGSVYTATATVE